MKAVNSNRFLLIENAQNSIKSNEIKEKYNTVALKLNMLENAINCLSEIEIKVIEKRCLNNLTWKQVTSFVGYSERQCKNIKKKALKNLSE
ncbi:hypothetical protein [Anaerosphaera multitolerans]|uniref:hypothetical protein n=1 Tax=Anaerosphaera multitolerans TaxID=2487351 RepID=UPI000FDBF60A|nr:hypothetical protein [Anaerosphaera multitolerans]